MDRDGVDRENARTAEAAAGPLGDAARSHGLLILSTSLAALGVIITACALVVTLWTPDFFTLAEVQTVMVLACWICPSTGLLTLGLALSMGGGSHALARGAVAANAAAFIAATAFTVSTWG